MKNKLKRALLLLMALLLCIPTLYGCKRDETSEGETGQGVSTVEGFVPDDLPDNLDYNQDEIRILHWQEAPKPEFDASDITVSVSEAVYTRNLEVSDRLNIKLKWIPTPGRDINAYSSTLTKDFQGGLYEYDILAAYSQSIATATYNGFTSNLLDLEYLNLQKPWWPDSLTKNAKIGNKLYFVSGDISTNALYFMYATFFNKNMIESYQLENPYELVEHNEWTIDKMFSMTKDIYTDYGDPGKDVKDELGMIIPWLSIDAYFYSSGLLTTENKNGKIVISDTYMGEKSEDLAKKLVNKLFHDDSALWMNTDTGSCNEAFSENRVLFITQRPMDAEDEFQSEDLVYGVVPTPKWDSDQQTYLTCIGNPFTLYSVYAGVSESRKQEMGVVLEALASAAYRITTPAVFEKTIKVRYAFDNITSEMYDIIRENIVFDVGRMFGSSMDQLTQTKYRNLIGSGDSAWISHSAGFKTQLKTYLDIVNDQIKSNNK